MSACCVCINGVNYTMACACNPCGGNGVSMSSVNPNPAVCQSVSGKDGGAGAAADFLNAAGRWGTALLGVAQGKPVSTTKTGVAVGARGSSTIGGMSTNSLVVLVIIAAVVIFLVTRG
jgi:hypothetical protein